MRSQTRGLFAFMIGSDAVYMTGTLLLVWFLLSLASTERDEWAFTCPLRWKTCGGVSTWDVQADVRDRKHERFRQLMTVGINGGALELSMPAKPSLRLGFEYGDDQKIDLKTLEERVDLVPTWPRRLLLVQGIDQTFGDAE